MRSCLKDQLSLVELRKEFEKFADSKIARELPDFYKACLDREDINDFFERQAVTTSIIDRLERCFLFSLLLLLLLFSPVHRPSVTCVFCVCHNFFLLFSHRFVRVGAEQEVNLNGQIRQKILVTEITR